MGLGKMIRRTIGTVRAKAPARAAQPPPGKPAKPAGGGARRGMMGRAKY